MLWTVLCAFATLIFAKQTQIYSNEFAVHIPDGNEAADEVAAKHGFDNKGQVSVQVFLNLICLLEKNVIIGLYYANYYSKY